MKKLLLFILIIISSFSAKAQENEIIVIDTCYIRNTCHIRDTCCSYTCLDSIAQRYTACCRTKIRNNWFITLSGGVGDLFSEQSRYVKFFGRIKLMGGLSFGKWVSPTVAFRVNITGSKLQGFTTWKDESNIGPGSWYFGKNHPYKDFNVTNNYIPAYLNSEFGEEIKQRYFGEKTTVKGYSGYLYEVPYIAETIDVMVDIRNLFESYNRRRLLDIYGYAGVGVTQTLGDHSRNQTNVNCIVGRMGGTLNFRLTKRIGINLDGNFLVVPEFFDWKVGDGNTMDIVCNYTIGLTYNFKNKKKHCRTECKVLRYCPQDKGANF